MNGLIEVADAGIANSFQDLGRIGYRSMGMAVSGCLDPIYARCANALVGNPPEHAVIEVRGRGPTLTVASGRIRFALTGPLSGTKIIRTDGSKHDAPLWRSISLDPGEKLQVGFVPGKTAYLAVSGGFATPVQLGSRSLYQRADIGTAIVRRAQIPCAGLAQRGAHEFAATAWRHDEGPIRVILGPQNDHFTPEAITDFLANDYKATEARDRMGMRLEGVPLKHRTPALADIVSDGVVPGAIQVPANGQPIILLADCQTVGGYPKIATVISADLPRLAQIKPGDPIRFQAVDMAQAKQALAALETRWKWWAHDIVYALPAAIANEDVPTG
jgi:5-oxoprolinase (ATP-hydrolysing) subunit C